jgi:WD40 repeat protein
VFVSSTFSDLKEERDALQKLVFPKLRELCMHHGCRFQAIDLRWGVRQEAGFDQQTLKICLEEIKRCQKTNLKPNFIVLLGDRYGWRPAPPEIPLGEFEEIEKHVAKEDIDLLRRWYLLDRNAKPAVYCLQPRTGEYRKQETWEFIENQLRSILLKGIAELKLSEKALVKYFESATEQEINQGLSDPEAQKHVFCFFRKIDGIRESQLKDFVDMDRTIGKLDDDAHNRLSALKDKLRTSLPNHCFEYQAGLTSEGTTQCHINKLCNDVYNSLEHVIQEEIKHFNEVDPLYKEIEDHTVFGEQRARFFVGRQEILGNIKDYLVSDSHEPLTVFGESGSGKTSLLAHAVQETQKSFIDAELIFRFIGATSSSTDVRSLLESLCQQIYKVFNFEEQKRRQITEIEDSDKLAHQKRIQIEAEYSIPIEYQKLSTTFKDFISKIPQGEKAVVFLDALDQLSSTDYAQDLSWLPFILPDHVHIVVSCLPSECMSILEQRLPPQNILLVAPMSRNEGKDLLNKWLNNVNRGLQWDQEKEVLDKFRVCGLPLYLKLVFEEVRHWKSYTEKRELTPTVRGIILEMFRRLSSNENYGEKMFSHSLGYLAAAKNGLTEDELLDVLSLDNEVFEDFKKSSFHELKENRLPVVVWSRLYFDLEPYLIERSADGTSLLGFYHRQLSEEVLNEYLKEDTATMRHGHLGQYFNNDFKNYPQPLQWHERGKIVSNLRKLSELPYQEIHGKQWDEVGQTLCDFHFVEAKCMAGKTNDLIADYVAALDALPEAQEEKQKELEHERRIKELTTNLVVFARGKISNIDIIVPVEPWSSEKIKQNIERITNRPTRLDRIRAFYQFIFSQSHGLIKFGHMPGFCLQQAYNSAISGPVASLAESILNAAETNCILLLQHQSQRPQYNPYPPLQMILEGHSDYVKTVSITPDGSRAVSGSSDKTLRLWDLRSGKCIRTLEGHAGAVYSVNMTPDCKRAVSGSADRTLRLWNLKTGECIKTLRGHTEIVGAVSITPDGSRAVSGSSDKTVRVWNLESGKCLWILEGHSDYVKTVSITPDGSRAVSGSSDKTLRLWDLRSGKCIRTLIGHTGAIRSVSITPDGGRAVSGSHSKYGIDTKERDCGDLRLWNLENGTCLRTLEEMTDCVNISLDGKRAICIREFGCGIILWNLESGEWLRTFEQEDIGEFLVVTSDGSKAVSCSLKTIKVWDIERAVNMTKENSSSDPLAAGITLDGKRAFSFIDVSTLEVWNLERGERLRTIEALETIDMKWMSSLITPDGSRVVTTVYVEPSYLYEEPSATKKLWVWDLESGNCFRTLSGHTRQIESHSLSPDGRYAVSTDFNELRIWDIEKGKSLGTSSSVYGIVNFQSMIFTPDGRGVILGNQQGENILIIKQGKPISLNWPELSSSFKGVVSITITPDGKRAVLGSEKGTIGILDLKTGRCVRTLSGHKNYVFHLIITPDGKRVISNSLDDTLRVWDIDTGECIAAYQQVKNELVMVKGVRSNGHLITGVRGGVEIFITLHNLTMNPPILTPVRLWLYGKLSDSLFGKKRNSGRWEDNITVVCQWCGNRFPVTNDILDTINAINNSAHLSPEQLPCLELPDEAWKDPRLLSKCPNCNKPLKFNPFLVDNKNRY